ncbi:MULTISPECIES: antibiotic biosynthesis monooxygenase [unclassified Mesorhizobium]|uniref:antibiotic biosynthesis monooxygenase n=1 Tax=unclassified Mesorhizobium TaxID=325217 RepID=UPI000FCC21E9|nr:MULTISPECIES: antibiotic biosynthesis monooxygenase [unclassified Mesorhizobium]RUV27067.1 antibiotic biosynthesis monooxygenase [Mesorhizobium sp. M1A.F.Ca.IN.022.04.1.1]RWG35552.1 MAG: antibiotic biosynthesis monooxygenase [Mesorhizobium sp.]TIS17798.1 MAG: antibiotic biosynthesis monooxygenase [Mesorhizobium sp.]
MNDALEPSATTLVNVLTFDPANQSALLELLRENTDTVITTLDGWISTSFIASDDGERVVIVSQWRDIMATQAMQGDPRMAAYFPKIVAFASFDSIGGKIAYVRAA